MLMNLGWCLSNTRSLISLQHLLQSSVLQLFSLLSSPSPRSCLVLSAAVLGPYTCNRGPQLSTGYSLTSISSCTTDTAEFGRRTLTPGNRSGPRPCGGHVFWVLVCQNSTISCQFFTFLVNLWINCMNLYDCMILFMCFHMICLCPTDGYI